MECHTHSSWDFSIPHWDKLSSTRKKNERNDTYDLSNLS